MNWDYLIITAANARQAEGFRAQLAKRDFPAATHVAVVPDPPMERIGNGGSTLNALRYIAERETTFDCLKVLVILSSGDSKRVPQYSALGKIFSPVPRVLSDGRASTLFDEIWSVMEKVPDRMNNGMFVLSGDVLLAFDPKDLTTGDAEAMAIAFPEPVEQGSGHGVFLSNEDGNIAGVWHKQSPEKLKAFGAVDKNGNVNIDTGAVYFSPKIMTDLYSLVSTEETFHQYVNAHIAPSLYVDFFYPLAENATMEGYLAETPEHLMSRELLELRQKLWQILRKYRIRLLNIDSGRFIHFGSTDEVARLMSKEIGDYSCFGWQKVVCSQVPKKFEGSAWCSVIEDGAVIQKDVFVERSVIPAGATVGNGSIVSYGKLSPGDEVPENVLLHCLRRYDGQYVCKISGIDENPKSRISGAASSMEGQLSFDQQSSLKTIGNTDTALARLERIADLSGVWHEGKAQILWDARIYPVRETLHEAVQAALCFWKTGELPALPRTSMNESFNDADGMYFI